MAEVIVIGAGIAGLSAAYQLSKAGVSCDVLEARSRIGGRIFSLRSTVASETFELGAEFVHGTRNIIWNLAGPAKLRISKNPDRHWIYANGVLHRNPDYWSILESTFNGIDVKAPDKPFDQTLREQRPIRDAWLVRQFVEGFYTADTTQISARSLVNTGSSDEEGADKSFRIFGGYSTLLNWLKAGIEESGSRIHNNVIVHTVNWAPGGVDVLANGETGPVEYGAQRAVIALPLGVMQAEPGLAGSVEFTPALTEKKVAQSRLKMGKVVKIVFLFSDWVWRDRLKRKDFGYLHCEKGTIRTWWSGSASPVLTAWSGGPQAESLSGQDRVALVKQALNDLGSVLDRSPERLQDQLLEWQMHDWNQDPFARGSYSYPTVGHALAEEVMARPVANTLFFAGEATVAGAARGTVHGALASGLRAAEHILGEREASVLTGHSHDFA